MEVVKLSSVNLLLTISEHHRTSPPGHACGPSPHSSRRRLFDLSAWWSKRHVGRQGLPRGKSAFRIHLDDCWRLCGRPADGGCDHLGLLLNLRGAHYRSRCAMQRCPRDAGGTARSGAGAATMCLSSISKAMIISGRRLVAA